jgi:hypothetical protein
VDAELAKGLPAASRKQAERVDTEAKLAKLEVGRAAAVPREAARGLRAPRSSRTA